MRGVGDPFGHPAGGGGGDSDRDRAQVAAGPRPAAVATDGLSGVSTVVYIGYRPVADA